MATMFVKLSKLVAKPIIWNCFIIWVLFCETSGINMRGTLKVDCFRIRPGSVIYIYIRGERRRKGELSNVVGKGERGNVQCTFPPPFPSQLSAKFSSMCVCVCVYIYIYKRWKKKEMRALKCVGRKGKRVMHFFSFSFSYTIERKVFFFVYIYK